MARGFNYEDRDGREVGELALDIETASPFAEPPEGANDTEYFELLAVAVAHRSDDGAVETDVLFRRGGWDAEFTADLFERLAAWCRDREFDRTLTYNGEWFDRPHLRAWAADLAASGTLADATETVERLFEPHRDLAVVASERHADELWPDQSVLPLWKACQLEGLDRDDRVWYEDHLPASYVDRLDVDAAFVKGAHVGRVLGERYVDGLVAGIADTSVHRGLRELLYTYAVGDVDVLFALHDRLAAAE